MDGNGQDNACEELSNGTDEPQFPNIYKMKYKDFILYADKQITHVLTHTPVSNLKTCLAELLQINLEQINQFTLIQRSVEKSVSEKHFIEGRPIPAMVEVEHPVQGLDSSPPFSIPERLLATDFFDSYFEACQAGLVQHARMIELETQIIGLLEASRAMDFPSNVKALFDHYIDILTLDLEMNRLEKSFVDYKAKDAYITYSLSKSDLTMNGLMALGQSKIIEIQNSSSRMSTQDEGFQPYLEASGYSALRDLLPPQEQQDLANRMMVFPLRGPLKMSL